jgi:hypothetical protein
LGLSGAYDMTPAASIHFAQEAQGRPAGFATLFTFGETLAIDRAASRVNVTMSAARFVWCDDRGRNTLALQAAEESLEARYAPVDLHWRFGLLRRPSGSSPVRARPTIVSLRSSNPGSAD